MTTLLQRQYSPKERKSTLPETMRRETRVGHYSIRTERSFIDWIYAYLLSPITCWIHK